MLRIFFDIILKLKEFSHYYVNYFFQFMSIKYNSGNISV